MIFRLIFVDFSGCSTHRIAADSEAARQNSGLLGPAVAMQGECDWNRYHYLADTDAGESLMGERFRRAWDWGFRKVKLDIIYGPRREMLALMRRVRRALASLPGHMELECHVPDPFFAQYCEVVRLNDVMIGPDFTGWRSVAQGHFDVCRQSAPAHLLNLDHLDGNLWDVGEADFLEHVALQAMQLPWGCPVVSLLPRHVGPQAEEAVRELLDAGNAGA